MKLDQFCRCGEKWDVEFVLIDATVDDHVFPIETLREFLTHLEADMRRVGVITDLKALELAHISGKGHKIVFGVVLKEKPSFEGVVN